MVNIEETIVKENAGLIWSIAKKFYGVNKNDLYQAGVLGIIKAYRHYQNDGEVKFSSYAYKSIYGEMYNVAMNKEIKLNKNILKLLKGIEKGRTMLAQELLREPSNSELAEFLGMNQNDMEQVMMYRVGLVSMDEDNNDTRDLHETISKKEVISNDDKIMLNDSINTLDNLEQDIIKSRYYEDLTQSETARKLGITQVMVSRYEKRSLKKLRDYMYM